MSDPILPEIWITRTEPGASESAPAWRAAGFIPRIAPLLSVRSVSPDIPFPAGGIPIFTSTNGVRYSGLTGQGRAYAVGERTAKAAREAGFAEVIVGPGQVSGLLEVIDRKEQSLVHVCGRRVTGDLVGALQGRGQTASSYCVYETLAKTVWSEAMGSLPFVALYSAFGAETFARLMPQDWQGDIVAFSAAVAEPISTQNVWIAKAPTQDALIDAAKLAFAAKAPK